MPVSLIINRTVSFFSDLDEAGQFDPGDIIYTRVTIQNTGDTAATGVTVEDNFVSDTLFGVTTNAATLNVSPIAFNDTFQAIGNTVLRVDDTDAGIVTINGGISTYVQGNLLSNDRGSSTVGTGIIVGDSKPGFTLDTVSNGTSANGGRFNIFADGSFNYVNDGSDTLVTGKLPTDSFTYTIRDVGLDNTANTADDLTSTATVTITFAEQSPGGNSHRVWYVDSAAAGGGDGTSARPFNTLDVSQINGPGGAGDIDSTGEFIYVKGIHTANFVLEAGQDLVGGGNALVVGGVTLANAGSQATLRHSGTGVTLSTDNTIVGLNIDGTAQGATGISDGGGTVGTLNISNVGINVDATVLGHNQGQILDIDQGGTVNISLNRMTAVSSTGANGGVVQLTGVEGSFTVTGATQIIGSHGQSGIVISNGTGAGGVDVTLGGTVEITPGAQSAIVFSGNGAGSSLTLNGGSKSINTSDVDAVVVSGNTGSTVTISGNAPNINTGSGGGGDGIEISGNNGLTLSVTSNLTASVGTGIGINILNNSGTNSITFSGASKDLDAAGAPGAGISMTGNSAGTTVTFSNGGLDVDTTGGSGIVATGNNGGTLIITGANNSISTGTGTALNVANTTIGAGGLNFVSINTSGAGNAINLSTTGSTAGLTVTGTGAAGTGGTITGSTNATAAITLNDTGPVSLDRMIIQNSLGDGISGTTVRGLTIQNSTIHNNGDAVNERGLDLTDVTGIMKIISSTFSNNAEDGIRVSNSSGTLHLTVTGSTFSNVTSKPFMNDGILLVAGGSSNILAAISGSSFSTHAGDHIQMVATATSTGASHLSITNNTFTNTDTTGADVLGSGVSIETNGSHDLNFNVANNNIQHSINGGAININLNTSSTAAAHLQGTIQSNTIGTAGTAGSGSLQANGIELKANGAGTMTLLVTNNQVHQWTNAYGIHLFNRDGSATVNATITNNTLTSPNTGTGLPINSIHIANGATATDSGDMYLELNGNNAATSLSPDVRIRSRFNGDIFMPGYAGGPNDTANPSSSASVDTFLTAKNPGVGEVTVLADATGTNGFKNTPGGAAVPLPVGPTAPSTLLADSPPADGDLVELIVDTPEVDNDESAGEIPNPPAAPAVIEDGVLSQAELDLIVGAAIQRWADAGASAEQIAAMRAVAVTVSNLGGLTLGQTGAGTIVLDDDAAGWRWFVDATPGEDGEYSGSGTRLSATDRFSLAGTRMDLLTVVTHELGHQIGLQDIFGAGERDELMYGTIAAGERRLPGSDDLAGAGSGPVAGAFAVAPIDIGTLPAGQTVTIEWRSTINAPGEDRPVHFIVGQTSVVGNNFSAAQSDSDPGLAGAQAYFQIVDGLRLSGLLYLDGNKDGDFDVGTDSALSGVTLLLFADSNNDGNYDQGTDLAVVYQDANNNNVYDAGDTPLAPGSSGAGVKQLTATSAVATGLYSFTNLAPGDYIVVVADSNFGAGTLGNKVAHGNPADPNNNVDNDNNAEQFVPGVPGTYAASRAIRLDYGLETSAGPGGTANDTNDTLDLGFDQPNQPPVIANLQGDAPTFVEGGTALRIDTGTLATVTDSDSPNFNTGSLTVAITGGKDASEDQLAIDTAGTGVTIVGSTVSVDGFAVGTLSGGGAGGGDLVIAFNTDDATPARIAKILNALTYFNSDTTSPTTAFRTVSVTLVDGDGEANGGDDDSTVTTTVNVTAVNDAPAGTDNTATLTTPEDTRLVLTAANFGFTDTDGNAFAGFVLTTAPGIGTLYIDTDGAGGSLGTALSAGNFVAIADINAGRLVYVPNANTSGAETFTFQVRDDGGTLNGGADTDASANTIGIAVTAVNDLPTIDLNAGGAGINNAATFTEDGAAVVLANALVLADADNMSLASATVTIGGFQAGDVLTISGSQSGTSNNVNYSYDSATGIMSLSGTALLSEYQAALRLITYSTPNQNPSAGRTITWAVNDGTATGPTANTVLTINAVNDSPSGADKTITVNEDDSYTFTLADFGFSDPAEGHNLQNIFVNGVPAQGDLRNNGVLVNSGDYILPSDVSSGLLVFTPDPGTFGVAYGDFSFQLHDDGGTANGGVNFDQSSNKITIDVTPDNVSPLLDLNGAPAGLNNTANVTEQSAPVTLAPNLAASDTDDVDFVGAAVSITAGAQASDTLSVAGVANGSSGGISWTYAAGTLTFTGTATVAAYEAILRQVALVVGGDAPGASRTVTWTVNDGTSNSVARTTAVTVTQVNDAPSGTNNTLTIAEDATHVFTLADFGFGDPEGHSFAAVAITTLPTNGTLLRDGTPIGIAGTIVLASEVSGGKLVFKPDLDENGSPYGSFTFQVIDNGGSANGGQDTDQSANNFTFNVTPVADTPVANNDTGATTESATTSIAVLTNDTDPDGPPLAVAEIAGTPVVAGQTVVLASGATAKLENNGTITYNPNGVYNSLTAPGSGAVNTSAVDTFTYKLAGGTGTANVSVTVNGVVSSDDILKGDSGTNVITGTPQNDLFYLQQGGNDTANGLAGNDGFYFGAAYTAADTVDGGEGRDQVALQGNYALTLGTLTSIADLILLSGTDTRFGDPGTNLYDYALTSIDSNVAAGATLLVDGTMLVVGEEFTFNGSAEMDGKFILSGGVGIDTWTGGAGADGFYFRHGTFWGPSDKVTGDATDQIGFRGDFTGGNKVVMGAAQIVGVETLVLMSGTDTRFGPAVGPTKFDVQMHDGNVGATRIFTVDGSFLASNETMRVDGSAEQDGAFRMFGGSGADILIGGAGNDILRGNGGGDTLTGNGGADQFRYFETADSTSGAGNFDSILSFTHLTDKIDLSGVDANSAVAGDQAFSFIGSAAFAGTGASSAGQLRAFQQNAGTNTWEVQADVNGDGVADMMIRVTVEAVQPLTVGDFML